MNPDELKVVQGLYDAKENRFSSPSHGHNHGAYCTASRDFMTNVGEPYRPISKGTTLRITMVSRFGDCGVSDDLSREYGYCHRTPFENGDICNIRNTRSGDSLMPTTAPADFGLPA